MVQPAEWRRPYVVAGGPQLSFIRPVATGATEEMGAHPPTTPGPAPKVRALGDDPVMRIALPAGRSPWAIAVVMNAIARQL